jgi:hypothetical protein
MRKISTPKEINDKYQIQILAEIVNEQLYIK